MKRSALIQERSTYLQLEQLTIQKNELGNFINQGIPSDGPTPPANRDRFEGCTNYVAERRNVHFEENHYIHGNAALWNDVATKKDWDVGSQPVKGPIIVFEQSEDPQWKDYGHVAYVEEVTKTSNGYSVIYSEASVPDANHPAISGTNHTAVTKRSVKIPDSGAAGISFIYDWPK